MRTAIEFIDFVWWLYFTKEGRTERKRLAKQENCPHDKWFMDKQIRAIECCECGKRAWVEDYKDLY